MHSEPDLSGPIEYRADSPDGLARPDLRGMASARGPRGLRCPRPAAQARLPEAVVPEAVVPQTQLVTPLAIDISCRPRTRPAVGRLGSTHRVADGDSSLDIDNVQGIVADDNQRRI